MNRQKDLNHARQKFLNIFLEVTFCGVNGTQNEDEGEDQIGCFVAHLGYGRSRQGDRAAITFPKVKSHKSRTGISSHRRLQPARWSGVD